MWGVFQIMQDCFKLSFFYVTIKFTSASFLHIISSNFPSMHLLILIRVVGALEPTPATIRRGVVFIFNQTTVTNSDLAPAGMSNTELHYERAYL